MSGWSGTAQENACDGLLTDVTLRYANANSSGTGQAGSVTIAFWQVVYQEFKDWATGKQHTASNFTSDNSNTGLPVQDQVIPFSMPVIRFQIPYNTTSTLLAWVAGLSGKTNSNSFSIGGQSFAKHKLRFGGAHERVVYDPTTATNKFIHIIEIDACNGWLRGSQGAFGLQIEPMYDEATFTVPPVPSVP